jgi:plastocyanin
MEDSDGESMEEDTAGEVMEEPAAAGGDVRILGAEGFDPEELKVSAGSTVAWLNEGDSGLTLNFMRDGRTFKAEYVKAGETVEMTFDEAGTVDYEALELRTKGTVTVE